MSPESPRIPRGIGSSAEGEADLRLAWSYFDPMSSLSCVVSPSMFVSPSLLVSSVRLVIGLSGETSLPVSIGETSSGFCCALDSMAEGLEICWDYLSGEEERSGEGSSDRS